MKPSASSFYSLRIYRKFTTLQILNLIMCNRVMKIKPIVANANALYSLSTRVLSQRFVNYMINKTFCQALTAGNTLKGA